MPAIRTVRALLGLALVNALVFVVSAYYVSRYYANNPPHFDSIGPLTLMYDTINRVGREGLVTAVEFALAYDSVSWVQSLYAAALAPVLPRTPVGMMTLNFACLFVAQAGMFDLGRRFGASRLHAFALGLLPLAPDALYGHYGSYQDMRRDASFLALLLAAYCASLAYLRSPTFPRAAGLGLLAGLTTWARGNALPYTAIVLLPAAVWAVAACGPQRRWAHLARLAAVPMLLFAALALTYYLDELSSLLHKYLYNTPDLNISRWESFRHYVWTPVVLLLGQPGRALAVKLAAALALPALLYGLVRAGEAAWQPRRAFAGDRRWLWIGGGIVIVGTLVLVTLIVGVSPIAGYEPSYPILIGVFSLLAGASFAVALERGRLAGGRKRLLAVVALLLVVLANGVDKLRLSSYPRQPENMQTIRELLPLVREWADGRRVTWMWDGNINYWVFNYYLAQAGQPRIEFYYGANPDRLPSPDFGETVESRALEIKQMLLSTDVLVISDTPHAYTGIVGPGFFVTYGYLIVPDVLADERFEQIHEFESDGYHFVVLQRQE